MKKILFGLLLFLMVTIKGFEFTATGLYVMTYDYSYSLYGWMDSDLIMVDSE